MKGMFSHCFKLKEIKGLNQFVTNNVTVMNSMFQLCMELEFLDVSNFDTSNVTNMSFMFSKCYKLKEIKGINRFITYKVTDMKAMFQLCGELEYLDLSNYNTANVSDMQYMFYKCNKLQNLNLLNFTVKCEEKNMLNMFVFNNKEKCEFTTNNKKLQKLFKSSK